VTAHCPCAGASSQRSCASPPLPPPLRGGLLCCATSALPWMGRPAAKTGGGATVIRVCGLPSFVCVGCRVLRCLSLAVDGPPRCQDRWVGQPPFACVGCRHWCVWSPCAALPQPCRGWAAPLPRQVGGAAVVCVTWAWPAPFMRAKHSV